MTKPEGRSRSQGAASKDGLPHWLVWGGVLVVGVLVGVMAFHALTPADESPGDEGLQAVGSIDHEHQHNHIHGVGYDGDGDRLFIATHFGLFRLDNATTGADALYQVGGSRDDYMGFSLDPNAGDRMFASGHPGQRGLMDPPNIGVVRSTDGGFTWQRVWDGPGGQRVDFHAMAISPADPDRLVGAFGGALHATLDGGGSWESFEQVDGRGHCWGAPCLAWDADDADRLWSGSSEGLFTRESLEGSWTPVADGAHGAVFLHPADNRLWAWSASEGLRVSEDEGDSWEDRSDGLPGPDPGMDPRSGEWVFQLTGPPGDADVLFAAAHDGRQVFRTLDGGESWQRVYPLS